MPVSVDKPDPIRLEVFHHLLAAVCEEAGTLLQRSAVSPNIRDRRDFSFALFDGRGRLIAQAAHIPVHLGSAGDAVAAARAALDLGPGDVAILNDPYAGGTHLPDITMVAPVFAIEGAAEPTFFLVNRAHHADVGGATPGSMGIASDLHGEGLVIPPVKLRCAGVPVDGVLAMLRANVRAPAERVLDLQAQEASIERASSRLLAMCREHGVGVVTRYGEHLMGYSAKIARSVVRAIPDGRYEAADEIEDDGLGGGPFRIALQLDVRGNKLRFDFREGTAAAARGGINANRSIVLAACLYSLRCLCPDRLPTNDGVFRVLEVLTEPGSLLDPVRPAPVAGGNVETSQRIVDVCLRALERALPGRLPACSAGTMSNFTLGGDDASGVPFAIYETLPGGAGAGRTRNAIAAVQTHMTNTRNTPIEELERRYPLLVRRLDIRRGSGGAGEHRGGDGIVKEVEALAPTTVTTFADRQSKGPPALGGGASAGRSGSVRLVTQGGRSRRMPGKSCFRLDVGERVRIETPGGGGWSPGDRP